jgi:hypothetical protein
MKPVVPVLIGTFNLSAPMRKQSSARISVAETTINNRQDSCTGHVKDLLKPLVLDHTKRFVCKINDHLIAARTTKAFSVLRKRFRWTSEHPQLLYWLSR